MKHKRTAAQYNAEVHSPDKNANSNLLDRSRTQMCSMKRKREFAREIANMHLHDNTRTSLRLIKRERALER